MEKSLEECTKEDLIAELKKRKQQKRYGLVWENKNEDVVDECRTKLPVVEEITERAIIDAPNEPTNLIIEGDNYHALSILNYTHSGKIDVIYIDPPYNTGNASWRYNNKIVDIDDSFRHSKFVSFLEKRLKLSKDLLSERGIIAVAIDDYEIQNVRLIMDELFGEENRLGTCVVIHNPGGRQDDKFFATTHEYMLVYSKNKAFAEVGYLDITEEKKAQYKMSDKDGNYKLRSFIRTGAHSRPNERPGLFYPIYVNPSTLDTSTANQAGWVELLPVDSDGNSRVWRWSKETFMAKKEKYIECRKIKGNYSLYVKERESDNQGYKPKTLWMSPNYSSASAIGQLKEILAGNANSEFPYPKSLYLMKDVLKILSRKDSIVLDYFAGSGTTGNAVLELNKEDGGRRQFIVCTNNENRIAEEVTYPRLKTVITGNRSNGTKYSDGISANLRYFRTAFVNKGTTSDDTRDILVMKCTDMIRIRENAFEFVASAPEYRFYKSERVFVPIIFDQFAIEETWKKVEELNTDRLPVHVYNFSYNRHANEEEIPETDLEWTACSIPESVLEVYRRIFRRKENKHAA